MLGLLGEYALALWPLWVPVVVGAAVMLVWRSPGVARATGVAWLAGVAGLLS